MVSPYNEWNTIQNKRELSYQYITAMKIDLKIIMPSESSLIEKNTYDEIPFVSTSRKCKIMHSDRKQLRGGCLGRGWAEGTRRGCEENLGVRNLFVILIMLLCIRQNVSDVNSVLCCMWVRPQ